MNATECIRVQRNTNISSDLLGSNDLIFKRVEDTLWVYLGTFTLVAGTLGHLLTVLVVMSSRSGRKQASSVYMTMLAVSGSIALYTGLLRFVVLAHSGDKINLKNTSELACKIHTMLSYFSLQYLAWIQATIAVDRLIAVRRPFIYRSKCDWRLGLCVVCVEFLACAALNTIIPVMVGITAKHGCTYVNQPSLWGAWQYIDLLSFSLIPATILILCNLMVIKILHTSKQQRCTGSDEVAKSITKMLIAANVIFLIATIPISVVYVVSWDGLHEKTMEVVYSACSIIQYMGVSATFFIYCIFGSTFRSKLKRLVMYTRHWKHRASELSSELTHPQSGCEEMTNR